MEYNFKKIEAKWQKKWEKEKIYEVKENPKKDKFYCLIEFPYPSGEGLHVGHPRSYTALDIVARKKRMEGKNVLYPIGWDAYGLPTENYAIKTGIQPAVATEKNIKNFTRQLKSLGFSFDWSREINTTDPEYYKWTQWMFLQFFKHGLAYKDKIAINWCTKCKIGLANEEVVNGVCERCGGTVVKKMKEQWMIKITKYAERLLQGLENVDYSPRIKEGQINWIGKSEGAEVDFEIKAGKINLGEKHSSQKIDEMFEVLNKVNDALAKEKIKVWFNGTFGVAGYYGHVFDDPRDVDCGVLLKDFDKARGVIENLGYKKIEDKENPRFRVSIYDAGGFTLEIGTFDHDLGDKIIELEGYKFRVPEPRWFAECYRITAPKERRVGKNDALRAEFLESISGGYKIKIFTTRPDTLFGATYMVLAPEHEMVGKFKSQITNWKEVEKYIGEAKRKSDLERTELQKEKTGVELKGIKAINPVNNEEIPIWVADYVLTGYGTGAIMAVPAHDERDFSFAKKFGLPIKTVVAIPPDKKIDGAERRDGAAALILNSENKILVMYDKMLDKYNFPRGGTEKGETPQEAALREAREETGYVNLELMDDLGCKESYFYAADKKVNRHRLLCGFSFRLKDEIKQAVHKNDEGRYDLLWMSLEEAQKKLHFGEDKIFIAAILDPKRICFAGEGTAVNSGFIDGLPTDEAKEKITKWLEEKKIGKKAVNYKLRDWVFSRQRYWGEPIPLVYCENCAKKKQKILLIHGLTGRADKNWMPWMKQQLENIGFEVFVPTMTTTEHPVLEKWMEELLPIVKNFGEDDVIVGHSLGGKATLHLMERLNKKINNIFLVAPAVGKMTDEELAAKKVKRPEKDYDTARIFWEKDLNWAKIKKNVGNATIIYSDNDQSVKLYGHDFWPHDWFIKRVGNYNHFTDKEYPVLFDVIRNSRLTGWVPVPEQDLPVELPKVKKYEPTDTGESPLAAIEKWVKTKCPKCGGPARRETDTMPNWAGSSWYFLRYADPKNKKEFANEKNLKNWMPVDWYNGGMEHTTLHLLYSRFWYKFLYDIGAVPKECGDEPYKKRTSHGLILGKGGEKMSKSRGNVVNPDDVVARFGADTLRVYEMFMGPFEQAIPWDEKGVVGVFRFLEKAIRVEEELVHRESTKISYEDKQHENDAVDVRRHLHRAIKKVGEDIETMKFNTVVAAMMSFLNDVERVHLEISQSDFEKFLLILAPFAPHLAEELWEKLGNKKSVHLAEWPKYDPALIREEEIDLIVQVNGKMRDSIKVKADIGEGEAKKIATESEKIKKWIEGQKIKKIIFVKGRLVNIVV